MEKEEVIFKLRGIKSLLYHVSLTDDQVEDTDFALILLCEELKECIEELNQN